MWRGRGWMGWQKQAGPMGPMGLEAGQRTGGGGGGGGRVLHVRGWMCTAVRLQADVQLCTPTTPTTHRSLCNGVPQPLPPLPATQHPPTYDRRTNPHQPHLSQHRPGSMPAAPAPDPPSPIPSRPVPPPSVGLPPFPSDPDPVLDDDSLAAWHQLVPPLFEMWKYSITPLRSAAALCMWYSCVLGGGGRGQEDVRYGAV